MEELITEQERICCICNNPSYYIFNEFPNRIGYCKKHYKIGIEKSKKEYKEKIEFELKLEQLKHLKKINNE